jgi:hypothetical protein
VEKLDTYISTLLDRHECVIIPDFGGFLLNTIPAGFHGNGKEMHPPSKVVSFNRGLNVNDGLLAMCIAEKENISYADALVKISNAVAWMKLRLSSGQPLHLINIGGLTRTDEDKLIFTPDYNHNYLVTSYGLPSLLVQPVERQSDAKILQLRERKIRPRPEEKTRARRSFIPAVSIAASVLIAMAVFFKNNPVDPQTVASALFKQQEVAKKEVPATNPAKTQETANNTLTSNQNLAFYIVGGSFKKETNAKTLVEKLQKKGFQAQILNTETGLFRVTYYKERDSTRADEVLHKIKVSENQAAWLLKW